MTLSLLQAQLFFLALTRVLATLIHVPVLGGQAIPSQVKLALGLLLTAVIAPVGAAAATAQAPLPLFAMGLGLGREMLVGTLAGFSAELTFGSLQMAGELMGLGAGFGAGRVINPTFEQSGSAIDQFFLVMTTLLFLVINGHHAFLLGLRQTFNAVPLNSPLPAFALQPLLLLTSRMLGAGVLLAAPVVGAALLADLTLGLLARVAPQVHVFFLGAPVKVALGLVTLVLAVSALFSVAADWFHALSPRMLTLLGA